MPQLNHIGVDMKIGFIEVIFTMLAQPGMKSDAFVCIATFEC